MEPPPKKGVPGARETALMLSGYGLSKRRLLREHSLGFHDGFHEPSHYRDESRGGQGGQGGHGGQLLSSSRGADLAASDSFASITDARNYSRLMKEPVGWMCVPKTFNEGIHLLMN